MLEIRSAFKQVTDEYSAIASEWENDVYA